MVLPAFVRFKPACPLEIAPNHLAADTEQEQDRFEGLTLIDQPFFML